MNKYRYLASEGFWKSFHALSSARKASVRAKWELFKVDPFDPRLGTHVIRRLSALQRTQVFSVVVEGDLRVIFIVRHPNEIYTLDVGTHDLYG